MDELQVGDSVMGLAPGCFGSSVIVSKDLMVLKPPQLSFAAAATTPTVYTTVFTAFGSSLAPGMKVWSPCPAAMCLNAQKHQTASLDYLLDVSVLLSCEHGCKSTWTAKQCQPNVGIGSTPSTSSRSERMFVQVQPKGRHVRSDQNWLRTGAAR